MAGVESIQKLEGAVVNRQAQNAHIVGIHYPVAKAHSLPLGQQPRCALAHGLQEVGVGIAVERSGSAAFGVVLVDDHIGQRLEFGLHIACSEMLKVAKAHKALGHAGNDGSGFNAFACHGQGRARQRQCARGGYA